jgi:hypothetical protein
MWKQAHEARKTPHMYVAYSLSTQGLKHGILCGNGFTERGSVMTQDIVSCTITF